VSDDVSFVFHLDQNLEKAAAHAHTCLTNFTASVKVGLTSHAGTCGPVAHCGAAKASVAQKVVATLLPLAFLTCYLIWPAADGRS